MEFKWNEEQEMLRTTVRTFAERDIRPVAFSFRDKGREEMPEHLNNKMRDMGLFGMTLPEEYGGGGQSPVDAILAMEEVGRVDPLFANSIFGTNFGPVRAIASYGTEQQKHKYIPAVCRGEGHVAISITEPEAGSAATHLKTRAVRDGDHYVVNGTKSFISSASTATKMKPTRILFQMLITLILFGLGMGVKRVTRLPSLSRLTPQPAARKPFLTRIAGKIV